MLEVPGGPDRPSKIRPAGDLLDDLVGSIEWVVAMTTAPVILKTIVIGLAVRVSPMR